MNTQHSIDFTVADIFSDNMVLQRDSSVDVWGTAPSGAVIKVLVAGQELTSVSKSNKWCAKLDPIPAGGPYEMTVISEQERVTYKNILFGDVWIAGGQSNMEYTLLNCLTASEDIPQANNDMIRHYRVPTNYTTKLPKDREYWQQCTPEQARAFSGVAYYFAKQLQEKLNIPIGIISCNLGGTSGSCWVAERDLRDDKDLAVYWDGYYARLAETPAEEIERLTDEYQEKVIEYKRREAIEIEKGYRQPYISELIGGYPWPPPDGPEAPTRPCGLYYSMVAVAAPYTITGAIWYQGESDRHHPTVYDKLLTKVIGRWRTDFQKPDLPFIIVQLPEYDQPGDNMEDTWAIIREKQHLVVDTTKNTAMICAMGYGEKNDIHPQNKKPIGNTLALAALNKVYNDEVEYLGPVFDSAVLSDGRITLSYTHTGDGLCVGNINVMNDSRYNPDKLIGFETGNATGEFCEAEACISGDKVIVSAKSDTKYIRYGWANYTECNLCSKNGLSALPFGKTEV